VLRQQPFGEVQALVHLAQLLAQASELALQRLEARGGLGVRGAGVAACLGLDLGDLDGTVHQDGGDRYECSERGWVHGSSTRRDGLGES
jgi:hypothetical protein